MKSITSALVVSGCLLALLGCLSLYYVFYRPYLLIREEQRKHHEYMNKHVCDPSYSSLPKDITIDGMTHKGTKSDCVSAHVFLSTPIYWGALEDMWAHSLIRFVLHGGNWQLQVAIAIVALGSFYMTFRKILDFIFSLSLVGQLTPSSTPQSRHSLIKPDGKRLHILPKENLFTVKSPPIA